MRRSSLRQLKCQKHRRFSCQVTHDQHRRLAGTDDPVGHAPQEESLESAVAVGAHDDEVDCVFLGVRDDVLVCSPFPEGRGDLETGVLELPREAFQSGLASGRLGFA